MHARMCARASLHTECPEARVPVPLEGASVSFAVLSVPLARALGLHHARPAHARPSPALALYPSVRPSIAVSVCACASLPTAWLQLRGSESINTETHTHPLQPAVCSVQLQAARAWRTTGIRPWVLPTRAHDSAANDADHRALLRRGGHRLLRMHRAQR